MLASAYFEMHIFILSYFYHHALIKESNVFRSHNNILAKCRSTRYKESTVETDKPGRLPLRKAPSAQDSSPYSSSVSSPSFSTAMQKVNNFSPTSTKSKATSIHTYPSTQDKSTTLESSPNTGSTVSL